MSDREIDRIVDRVLGVRGRHLLAEGNELEAYRILVDRVSDALNQGTVFIDGKEVGLSELQRLRGMIRTPSGDVVVSDVNGKMAVLRPAQLIGIVKEMERREVSSAAGLRIEYIR